MKKPTTLISLLAISLFWGCEKFLAEKTNKTLVVPSSVADLQSLMDNQSNINNVDLGHGEVAADDYYLLYDVWTARSETDQRAYVWEPEYSTISAAGWFPTYRIVYWANIVLKNLENIERTPFNERDWNNVKGQAHFLRAKSFLQVVGIWSLAYDENTASTDLGIPLRLTDNFNVPSSRSTLEETYMQIIDDLERAIDLLPATAEHVVRPSKPAALALLARVYLFMRDYERCLQYANASLQIRSGLMDYNELDPSTAYPIPQFNVEVIYHSQISNPLNPTINMENALVDTFLYNSYLPEDLRKTLFFRSNANSTKSIRGNYTGGPIRFSGIATDEVYLMRAECRVRLGSVDAAMEDLNHLLAHRYDNSKPFVPLIVDNQREALQYVLQERRKQLLMRGLRFADVKRLNKEGADIGFKRILQGVTYRLPPNDLRFAVAIPEEVIDLAPDILQNPR